MNGFLFVSETSIHQTGPTFSKVLLKILWTILETFEYVGPGDNCNLRNDVNYLTAHRGYVTDITIMTLYR